MFAGAALTEGTARWCGAWADALITVAGPDQRKIVDAFREAAGTAKPAFLQVALAYASTEPEAEHIARAWAFAAAGSSDLKADLELPEQFDAAAAKVSSEALRRSVRVATSAREHVDAIARDLEHVDRVYVHHVSPRDSDHQRFLAEVAPGLVSL